ncbi:MAG: sigma 54 modulation/S30EA ribosomal C-terminal domain-containing protein [Chloroflexi bacterium]|nr:sigma 54 modulation/S30EA ribosomal C-terminal domain-containing protein [Chloroflexota bacterium]
MAIDRVAAVMVRQLEHHKGKLYEKGRGISLARGIPGEEAGVPEPGEAEAEKRVVKIKRFLMKPMTETEAISEMENLGHDFFLFLDAGTKQLRLLYRRKDGNYGLIEPELG